MNDDENLPVYNDGAIPEDVGSIENEVDSLPDVRSNTGSLYGRDDGDDMPDTPDSLGTVLTKYRVEAEVPNSQKKSFDVNKAFHGRHVALSNTRRGDNPRHLDAQDLCMIYSRMPTLRHRGTQIRMRETSEFQMCRSNQEIGGFEAKLAGTVIRKEDVDVRQTQNLNNGGKTRRSGILGFMKRKK